MKTLAVGVVASAVMAVGAYSTAGSGDRVVTVTIEHSTFSTGTIEVEPGESVTFEIQNNDPIDHEFLVGGKKMQRVHEEGTEGHHGDRPTEVSVPAGESRTTTIEFTESDELSLTDPLIYGCHLPGHYDYGMRGEIEVSY
ncbi:MAG TPA: cupredoxin domain-containing protein [Actinomycetota bacterium]|nr:cupredoxin domain-containing protein [Actinomycetota bacterium]